ncbi:MAG: hypothetical protein Q8O61_11505, partial [Nocardioides sp.]|nr:hypothetical protein [Nocardioides sp.]
MRRALLAPLVAAALLLGGCSDDEEPEAEPTPAPSAGDIGSPSVTPTPTPTPSPSEPTPAAPAATGPLHETSAFTMRGATPDTEIAGQPAIHLSGRASTTRHAEVYIMLRDGVVVEIDFEMLSDEPERGRTIA